MSLLRIILAAAVGPVLALPATHHHIPTVEVLGRVDPSHFLENIVTRPNGDILINQLAGGPDVFTVKDPASPHHRSFQQLTSIPEVQGLTGIAELPTPSRQETYVLIGGNYSSFDPVTPMSGTFSAWTLAFGHDEVELVKVSDLNDATGLANGVATVPHLPNVALVADALRGLVGRLDISTGIFEDTAFNLPEMLPVEGAALAIGVNGVKVHGSFLYFSNSAAVTIYRVPITPDAYPIPNAAAEVVANMSASSDFVDDFTFDAEGNIFAATYLGNSIRHVDVSTGESRVVVGGQNDLTVAGNTAVALGRRPADANTLYVTTTPATIGNRTEVARVVAVHL